MVVMSTTIRADYAACEYKIRMFLNRHIDDEGNWIDYKSEDGKFYIPIFFDRVDFFSDRIRVTNSSEKIWFCPLDGQAQWQANHIDNDPFTYYSLHIVGNHDKPRKVEIIFTASRLEIAPIMRFIKYDKVNKLNNTSCPARC